MFAISRDVKYGQNLHALDLSSIDECLSNAIKGQSGQSNRREERMGFNSGLLWPFAPNNFLSSPGYTTASFLLYYTGKCATAPCLVASSTDPYLFRRYGSIWQSLVDVLSLNLKSKEQVCLPAELMALCRFLCTNSVEWRDIFSEIMSAALQQLPEVLKMLSCGDSLSCSDSIKQSLKEVHLSLSPQDLEKIWIVCGSLCVFGGFVGGLHAGARAITKTDGSQLTIVARNEDESITAVRNGESELIVLESLKDIAYLPVQSFDLQSFLVGIDSTNDKHHTDVKMQECVERLVIPLVVALSRCNQWMPNNMFRPNVELLQENTPTISCEQVQFSCFNIVCPKKKASSPNFFFFSFKIY